MKTILIALDFSPISQQLIAAARSVATQESKVYFLHVAAPDPDFVGLGVGPEYVRDNRAETLRNEHEKLAQIKSDFEVTGHNAEALLIAGPTVETILEKAEKLQADLLIIGKRGHSALHKIILGSVCQGVIDKISIPILVIPAEK